MINKDMTFKIIMFNEYKFDEVKLRIGKYLDNTDIPIYFSDIDIGFRMLKVKNENILVVSDKIARLISVELVDILAWYMIISESGGCNKTTYNINKDYIVDMYVAHRCGYRNTIKVLNILSDIVADKDKKDIIHKRIQFLNDALLSERNIQFDSEKFIENSKLARVY